MNRNFKKIACFMATALLLAACAQDEMTDGNSLPEGKYPLQIASVSVVGESTSEPWGAKGVQSRVTEESTDGGFSLWEDGDLIGIGIEGDGYTSSDDKKYEMTISGEKVNVAPPENGTYVYWKNTKDVIVNAWYSNISEQATITDDDKMVSLTDQSSRLAYVLKGSGTGNYNRYGGIPLFFTHSLAKVRVKVNNTSGKKVTGIKIMSYTTCTITKGEVSGGSNENWITMKQCDYSSGIVWEANVVPGTDISKVKLNNTTECTLTTPITPDAGKINTITLTVTEAGPKLITDGESISKSGEYTMNGSYSQTITIQNGDNVTLTLDKVTSTAATAIKVESGRPTIIVKGENTFTQPSDAAPSVIALDGDDAHIILDGQGSGKLTIKQTHQGAENNAVIGGANNSSAGNIEIKDMSLHIDLTERKWLNGAVIGSGGANGKNVTCGDITIANTDLTVSGGNLTLYGAVIGTGTALNKGSNKCGNIKITLKSGLSKDQFLNKLDVKIESFDTWTLPEKVGKGRAAIDATYPGYVSTGNIEWYDADGKEI